MIAQETSHLPAPRPVGNTGLEIPEVPSHATFTSHLDTLVLVGNAAKIQEIIERLDDEIGLAFDWGNARPQAQGRVYELVAYGVLGCTMAITPSGWDDTGDYRISFSGQYLNSVDTERLRPILQWLRSIGSRSTSFHWAIDDYLRVLSLSEYEALATDECYHGARSYMLYRTARKRCVKDAQTVYIGAWGGEQQIAIYDKNIESKGAINAIRLEFRFRADKANYMFNLYAKDCSQSEASDTINRTVIGRIGFCASEQMSDYTHNLVKIWKRIESRIGDKIPTKFPTMPTTIERKKAWVGTQVVPSMCEIIKQVGWKSFWVWLRRLLSHKLAKLKPLQLINNNYLNRWKQWAEHGGEMPEIWQENTSNLETTHSKIAMENGEQLSFTLPLVLVNSHG